MAYNFIKIKIVLFRSPGTKTKHEVNESNCSKVHGVLLTTVKDPLPHLQLKTRAKHDGNDDRVAANEKALNVRGCGWNENNELPA